MATVNRPLADTGKRPLIDLGKYLYRTLEAADRAEGSAERAAISEANAKESERKAKRSAFNSDNSWKNAAFHADSACDSAGRARESEEISASAEPQSEELRDASKKGAEDAGSALAEAEASAYQGGRTAFQSGSSAIAAAELLGVMHTALRDFGTRTLLERRILSNPITGVRDTAQGTIVSLFQKLVAVNAITPQEFDHLMLTPELFDAMQIDPLGFDTNALEILY